MSAPSLDLVCNGIIVGDLDRKLLRKLALQTAKHLFIFFVATAQHGHDQRQAGQVVGNLRDQVKSFLRSEPGDNAHHRKLRVSIGNAEHAQPERYRQCLFANRHLGRPNFGYDRKR